ncbi:hypothetical protein ACN28C_19460 [Plantactinospora sp. WMMC1484]|uniref:hypothetical protein n=1 Tax=Plantactinospora sp. WMMC1484 TaxID=3404122 RepID=UPI003BF5BD4C
MAESPEHQFLSDVFLSTIMRFANSDLYSYRESRRKKFDFSCILAESWEYALDGQTLWRHPEGVDKDLRTLLFASDAHIAAYVARDTTRHRSTFHEATQDFRSSNRGEPLKKLHVFWIPADFDADSESARRLIARQLEREVAESVLFNVVFGRLSPNGLRAFVHSIGMPDLGLRVLYSIATRGFSNYSQMSAHLQIGPRSIKEQVLRLQMSGLLLQPRSGIQDYYVSSAGRTLLRICAQIRARTEAGKWLSSEVIDILHMLEAPPDRGELEIVQDGIRLTTLPAPRSTFMGLLLKVVGGGGEIDWENLNFRIHEYELDSSYWM